MDDNHDQTGPLPFRDSGGDSSPPLLLIHALGADVRMWAEMVARLDPPRRNIAINLPGAGAEPFAVRRLTFEDQVNSVLDVIAQLQLERVVPVGCAVGSMVACAVAARLGPRAPALVLINPILRITPEAGAVLLERGRRIRDDGIGAIESEVLDKAFAGVADAASRAAFRQIFLQQTAEGYAELASGFVGVDIAEAAATLACPTLLVPGRQDAVLPRWHQDELCGLIADVRCRPVNAGHFAPQQAAGEVAAAIGKFLTECAA